MNRDMRCEEIIKKLSLASSPVSATTLAKDLGVSRQVIVQDDRLSFKMTDIRLHSS